MNRLLTILLLSVTVLGQRAPVRQPEFQYQDELSAPPLDDFLPSGYTTTTTETPTAPPLPSPVDAVPAGFDQRNDNEEFDDEPEAGFEPVTHGSQVEKVAEFQNVEDVDVAAKVDNVRQVAPLEEDPVAVEDEEVEEEQEPVGDVREAVAVAAAVEDNDAADGHIEIHEQVVEDVVTEEPQDVQVNHQPASQEQVEQLNQEAPVEQVQQFHRVRPAVQLQPSEQVDDVEEIKPVEKVKPQKFNRLRTKISEVKKAEKPEAPVELKKPEPQPCDAAVHDCEGCAYPKHARNCRVKYFKDQARIKTCTDADLIAKHILDQCPAKVKPAPVAEDNY